MAPADEDEEEREADEGEQYWALSTDLNTYINKIKKSGSSRMDNVYGTGTGCCCYCRSVPLNDPTHE